MTRMVLAMLAAAALAACVTSPVADLGDGRYLASIHTMFGVTSKSALTDQATGEAMKYCQERGEVAELRDVVDTGVPGLTNLSANVVFSCVQPHPQPSAAR
jgi:hypothetical protein